jgi:uncharacterized protein YjbI with pentapeptide repeats
VEVRTRGEVEWILRERDWSSDVIVRVDFKPVSPEGKQHSDLRGVNLDEANLRGVELGGANLSGSSLLFAELHRADLGHANLSGADLRGAKLWSANLRGASLLNADLGEGGSDVQHAPQYA